MPNSCPFCGKVIVWNKLVCDECEADLPDSFNGNIAIENTEGAVGVFYYDGKVIDLIYKMKHGSAVHNFPELCAGMIAERLDRFGFCADIVTAVPMYFSKKLIRGGNQAELLAKFVSAAVDKPVDLTLLKRNKDSTEQHKLEKDERESHAEEVYSAGEKHSDIKGKAVLICDDVITTGSTIRACAYHLKKMGAQKVYACSVAVSEVYRKKTPDDSR